MVVTVARHARAWIETEWAYTAEPLAVVARHTRAWIETWFLWQF